MQTTPLATVPTQRPGVVMAAAYSEGRRVSDVAVHDAGDWSRRPGHLVWIGLYEPSAELLGEIREQFGLHPLAIDDAKAPHQRPSWNGTATARSWSPEPPSWSTGA